MPRLLVIDDRDQTVEMCHRHLGQFDYVTRCDRRIPCQVCEERDRGCRMKCAHDYFEAAETLGRLDALPDLVVLDLHFAVPEDRLLPEDKSELPQEPGPRKKALEDLRRRQGLLILERLRHEYPQLPVVLLTTTEEELGTPAGGASDPLVYFCENEIVDSRTLASEITRALKLHHQAQEGPIFWGKSPAMADLRRALGTLARSPLPVLLHGETGTGKSFLAEHFIHPRSGAKGPLVTTDLSTVPPPLLPAHLLGARRGSYTGAVEDHPGVFEQAHGGTLFLDEIANLDLELQRQLLLVLERGQVTRLGDVRARPAQVKLVAATHQDLAALVREGRFRADLYMRLNPATRLRVPALRERREDLPELIRFALLEALRGEALRPLVRAFLARFPTPDDFREERSVVHFGKPAARHARRDAFAVYLSRHALDRLVAHDWPGNLRELKMLATNALVFTLVGHLEAAEAGGAPGADGPAAPGRSSGPAERAPAVLTIADALMDQLLGQLAGVRAIEGRAAGARGVGARGVGARAEAREAPLATVTAAAGGGWRVDVAVRPGTSFSKISADVERQYLEALFHEVGGDLDRMASELLGPGAGGRRVHLRLNQLGLHLRELRK
ncbi:MAG TPA: sigma 54-interacting transcriptional regulator [Polyangia bacterium]|nr:sigma 54-interacting transcriptional regulator [Polyangia bacterium]